MEPIAHIAMMDIRKSYDGRPALGGTDLSVLGGEIHLLVGENGAGKTTLMKILAGIIEKDAGRIMVAGTVFEPYDLKAAKSCGIHMIFQDPILFRRLTVAENLFIGREPQYRHIPLIHQRRINEDAQKLLSKVGLDLSPRAIVDDLSLGQQRLVEVVRALTLRTSLLILDEPTASLSDREIALVYAVIRELRAMGITILMVTHRLRDVGNIGDRISVMRDGKVIETRAIREISDRELLRLMARTPSANCYPKLPPRIGTELLRVEGLSKGNMLKDISFTLRRGEILGLAGLLGSGRTTLARTLFGADKFDSGAIILNGRTLRLSRPADAVRHGISYVTEDRLGKGLFTSRNIRENITITDVTRVSGRLLLNRRKERLLVDRYLSDLGLKVPDINASLISLSGGNQQKVVLAKWLHTEAKVFILDEPTRGLDVEAKIDFYNIMNGLTRLGAGILLISSDLPELIGMSDRILVMYDGRICKEFGHGQASEELILKYASGSGSSE